MVIFFRVFGWSCYGLFQLILSHRILLNHPKPSEIYYAVYQPNTLKIGDEEGNPHPDYDHLTPAERRYMEQKQKIDMQKLAKVANKSHRDRIQDFNQYLANLSEHYDIPKVGPG